MNECVTVRLSDLCHLIRESVKPRTRPEALYLGLEHLVSGQLVRTGGGQASEMRSTSSAFHPGDVLYGKLRPYLDKAVLADEAGVCTTELLVLRAKADVDPRFLAVVVHSPDFLEYAVAGTTGVQHPRTSWAHIREFEVSAFTLDEQQRIADILWLIQEAAIQSEALVEEGQALKRAAMSTLFTRGLRGEAQKKTEIGLMPESWEILSVAEAVRPFRFERTQQVPKSEYAENGRWPIIDQGQDFIGGYVDDETRLINSAAPIIIFGDHTRIFKFVDFEFALGAQGTKPLLAEDGFNSKYLYYALCNLDVPPRGYNRHYKILSQMHIGKPDPSEQREIVTILDTIDRKIDLHRRKRAVLDDLFKALLHKLMTGEIRVGDLDLRALIVSNSRSA